MSDFSVMLRQSYDGSKYDREAKSADAVNVHIDHLLWNVTMCGTPDALYRVVSNYTDGHRGDNFAEKECYELEDNHLVYRGFAAVRRRTDDCVRPDILFYTRR